MEASRFFKKLPHHGLSDHLLKHGWKNQYAPDMSEYCNKTGKAFKGGVYTALCDSEDCVPENRRIGRVGKAIIKNVSRRTKFCPDCGSAIYWARETA